MPRGMGYDGIGDKQGAANKVGVVQQHVASRVDAFGENVLAVGVGGVGNGIAGKGRALPRTIRRAWAFVQRGGALRSWSAAVGEARRPSCLRAGGRPDAAQA